MMKPNLRILECDQCRDRGWLVRGGVLLLCGCGRLGSIDQATWCAERAGISVGQATTLTEAPVGGLRCPKCGNLVPSETVSWKVTDVFVKPSGAVKVGLDAFASESVTAGPAVCTQV